MKVSVARVMLPVLIASLTLAVGVVIGTNHALKAGPAADGKFIQQEMNAYCTGKLNDSLSKLSPKSKKDLTEKTFFSRRLHTCIEVEVASDSNSAGAMNYILRDLTYGFVAAPNWHHSESPLHVHQTDIRSYHHLSAEGYWLPVSSDPTQQSVSDANAVKLSCEYTEDQGTDSGSNTCTETEGYTEFGTIQTDAQTYHIASWSHDEVIATDSERGLSGSTTTTLVIHPQANEIEIVDRTRMDEKQPNFNKGIAGKSFGGHYELHGGMYLLDTAAVLFKCNEDGVLTDMRFDVVEKYHGDVVEVPNSEWNAGAKANHKFTEQECSAAMQKALEKITG